MSRGHHDSREDARRFLAEQGYNIGFSSPGRPELWIKGRSRVAVARRVVDADEQWLVLPYPEPSTATPSQVAEFAKRDGVVLHAGKLPAAYDATTMTVSPDTVVPDPDNDLL